MPWTFSAPAAVNGSSVERKLAGHAARGSQQSAIKVTLLPTEAQTYEAEHARAAALAEIDRAKTAFFSNLSHEFRAPLALLLGPLEEALQQPSTGLSGEALNGAHRNALRLLKLVNTLLDVPRRMRKKSCGYRTESVGASEQRRLAASAPSTQSRFMPTVGR